MTRLLVPEDAAAYLAFRQAMLRDSPLAFASSPDDDRASSVGAVRVSLSRAPEAVVIGAFDDGLIGSIGLFRDHHRKAAHKAHIWGMYVTPDHRGRGVGRRLLDAAIAHARTLPGVEWVHLSVSEAAPTAKRLYEKAGFQTWGREPDALRHDGRSASEWHMALELKSE